MKYLIMLLVLAFAYANSFGQATFNIRERYGFPACVLTSIIPTDSCYYVTGLIADTIPPYKAGILFMRIDIQGNATSIKTIKSTQKTYELWDNSLSFNSNNELVAVGYTRDSTIKSMLVKFNQLGDTLFISEFFSPYYPIGNQMGPGGGMAILSNGNYILINWAQLQDNPFGNDTNYYLIATDSLGTKLWDKIYSTSKFETPHSNLVTPDGKIICGGIRTNQTTNVQNFTFQCHIFQVDSLGIMEWEWLSPVSDGLRDAANDMLLLDDGSLIVVSGVGHEIQHASVNEVFFDRYIFKLNPQRQIEWELSFPDSQPTYYPRTTNLVELNDGGGYVMAGMSFNPEPTPPYGEPVKGWLAKVSPDGDSIWTRRYAYIYPTPLIHTLYDMKETPDGGLILCGQAQDLVNGATYPQQGWLLKLDQYGCLVPGCQLSDAVEEEQPQSEISLSIYPNPTSDYLNFYVNAPNPASGATIRIINAEGGLVREFKTGSFDQTFIVPVWDWASGAYWLQYSIDGSVAQSEKFIKL